MTKSDILVTDLTENKRQKISKYNLNTNIWKHVGVSISTNLSSLVKNNYSHNDSSKAAKTETLSRSIQNPMQLYLIITPRKILLLALHCIYPGFL